ncbi:hypothetical protein HPB48_019287 [Haemaphysalis longicornis]|uniref:Uncharacterized protein n=1 Tax=Haemaphysalis longicornis TaxID=44386 RepID=A0A9J6F6P9_HAELO|nr:hypothetical protein HPB48_019287 [Haemaphysalis longicornis]
METRREAALIGPGRKARRYSAPNIWPMPDLRERDAFPSRLVSSRREMAHGRLSAWNRARKRDQPIYPSARITKAESMLMVMAHSFRHDQSKEATESLLKIITMHLPEGTPFPATKYLFFKNFSAGECSRTRHFYCSACSAYIGEVEQAAVSTVSVNGDYCGNIPCTHSSL